MNSRILWAVLSILIAGCGQTNSNNNSLQDTAVHLDAAITQMLKEAKESPNNIVVQEKLFNQLDSAGLYSLAIQQLNLLIQKDSLNEWLWYQKGYFSERMKDSTAAIQFYKFSNRIYPTPKSLLSLANLLAEKKDTGAIAICNQLVAMYPGRDYLPDVYFIKGVYFARTGNLEKATDFFNKCIYTNYRYLEAYMEKGFILYDKKQIQSALSIFATITKLDPLYTDGYYWQAKCYELLTNKDTAIIFYEKALMLDSSLTEAKRAINQLK